jgi:hypothetical protein
MTDSLILGLNITRSVLPGQLTVRLLSRVTQTTTAAVPLAIRGHKILWRLQIIPSKLLITGHFVFKNDHIIHIFKRYHVNNSLNLLKNKPIS